MKKTSMLALVACAGAVMSASAQDSVAPQVVGGLPGDAPDPYVDPTVVSYILDLDLHFGSWGTEFAVGPVLKGSKTDSTFFTGLTSGQMISQDVLSNVNFASPSYDLWETPGFGVSGNNTPANQVVTPSGEASQVAVHMSSFGGNLESIQAALINFDPADPTRLYVTRVQSATNQAPSSVGTFNFSASLGVGGIDAAGNAHLRADDFNTVGPFTVTGDNWVRVRNQDRGSVLNFIDSSDPLTLGRDATDDLLRGFGDTATPPAIVPASIGGTANGGAFGTDFDSNLRTGAGPVLPTTAHRPVGTPDHRGVASFSPVQIFPNSVGTGVLVGKDPEEFPAPPPADPGETETITKRILVFGVDGNGDVTDSAALALPDMVSDPLDPFTIDSSTGGGFATGLPEWTFDHYRGVSTFRGAAGIAAVGFDPISGKALAASTVQDRGTFNDQSTPYTAMVVCRFDPANPADVSSQEWTIAAWADFDNLTGKPILDGPGGAPIGTIISYDVVTGGNILGPAMSVPSFDARGNVYFLAGVSLNKVDPITGPFIDTDTALVRGIYDSATNSYELELVIEAGNVFQGQNSGRNYQVQFITVATGNGSAAPSGFWANSVNQNPLGGVDPAQLDPAAPQAMTGVVLAAQIVYDVNGDDNFDNPTSGNGNPLSPDQAYNVLLYISSNEPAQTSLACSPADITTTGSANGTPDGVVDLSDFSFYLTLWSGSDAQADITTTGSANGTPDGVVDLSDFSFYLTLWSAGCP